jgi:hypothetical protein
LNRTEIILTPIHRDGGERMEIKMTEEEMRAGINGFDMKDDTIFMIRKVNAEDNGTSVQGLHIRGWEHGNTEVIMVKKRAASYTELVEEMRKEGY